MAKKSGAKAQQKRKMKFLLVLLLISAAMLFSGCITNYGSGSTRYQSCRLDNEWNSEWVSATLLVVMTIYMFLAIVYIGSVLFKKLEWLDWAKSEFYQGLITLLLLGCLCWFVSSSCDIVFTLTGSARDPFTTVDTYLNNLVWQKTINTAMSLYLKSTFLQIIAANSTPTGMNPKSQVRLFSGFNGLAQAYDFLFSIVSAFFSSLLIQIIWLKLIQGFAFKLLLPIGIFFRAIPFLRQAGATFIALALGFYLVFPMMYIMDMMIMDNMDLSLSRAGYVLGNIVDLIDAIPLLGDSVASTIDIVTPAGAINEVAVLLPQALVLPTLNIIITLAFVKSATKILSQNFASAFWSAGDLMSSGYTERSG